MKAGNPKEQPSAPSPPAPSIPPKPLEIYNDGFSSRKAYKDEINNVFASFDASDLNSLNSGLAASQLGSMYTFTTKEKQFTGSKTLFFLIEIKIKAGVVISHLSVHMSDSGQRINARQETDDLGMVHCVNEDWKTKGIGKKNSGTLRFSFIGLTSKHLSPSLVFFQVDNVFTLPGGENASHLTIYRHEFGTCLNRVLYDVYNKQIRKATTYQSFMPSVIPITTRSRIKKTANVAVELDDSAAAAAAVENSAAAAAVDDSAAAAAVEDSAVELVDSDATVLENSAVAAVAESSMTKSENITQLEQQIKQQLLIVEDIKEIIDKIVHKYALKDKIPRNVSIFLKEITHGTDGSRRMLNRLKIYIDNNTDEIQSAKWQILFLKSIIENDIFNKITIDTNNFVKLEGINLYQFEDQIPKGGKKISKKIRKFYKKSKTIN